MKCLDLFIFLASESSLVLILKISPPTPQVTPMILAENVQYTVTCPWGVACRCEFGRRAHCLMALTGGEATY